MAKKRTKRIDPEPEPEIEDEIQEDSSSDDDDGLTYTKRYTVSIFQPAKSYIGCKCYKDFYETDQLADAKKTAEATFKEENLEVVIWDRERFSDDPIRYIPDEPVKDDEDDSATTKPAAKTRRRTNKKDAASPTSSTSGRSKSEPDRVSGGNAESLPRPKHPRRRKPSS